MTTKYSMMLFSAVLAVWRIIWVWIGERKYARKFDPGGSQCLCIMRATNSDQIKGSLNFKWKEGVLKAGWRGRGGILYDRVLSGTQAPLNLNLTVCVTWLTAKMQLMWWILLIMYQDFCKMPRFEAQFHPIHEARKKSLVPFQAFTYAT